MQTTMKITVIKKKAAAIKPINHLKVLLANSGSVRILPTRSVAENGSA